MSAKLSALMNSKGLASPEELNEFIENNPNVFEVLELEPKSPMDEAQQIMWAAFDEPSSKKKIALAEKALQICSDCADAYLVLAEEQARSAQEAIDFCRKGVEAGKRALGEEVLNSPDTRFWSEIRTRPYMRSMKSLACLLQEQDDESNEAIQIFKELIRLNPNDNQGVRMLLAPALVAAKRFKEAEELFKMFDDSPETYLMYSRVLYYFMKFGDCPLAVDAIWEAVEHNPYVVEIMSGALSMPPIQDAYYSPGSPEEARAYLRVAKYGWTKDNYAPAKWLADVIKRDLQLYKVRKNFPGLTFESDKSNNVINLNPFTLR